MIGLTVKSIRVLTPDELDREGFGDDEYNIAIEFDDGSYIFASSDEEGNGWGCIYGRTHDGVAFQLYPESALASRVMGHEIASLEKGVFQVGDHVENTPVATVDGIVYAVEGELVRFCDEYGIRYSMKQDGLAHRYKRFDFLETARIMEKNSHLFD